MEKEIWQKCAVQMEPPQELLKPLRVPEKILMSPGPSNCSARVLRSMSNQVLGHLHPETCEMMDATKAGLQYLFQTKNRLTLALSASGHGAMEACLANLVEPGEIVLIAQCGIWGRRATDMAERIGAHVELLESECGTPFDLEQLEAALKRCRPIAVFIVHAESSTGMKQPLEGVGDLVHRYNGLLIVDGVASIGGEAFFTDAWGIDAVYTGSQKVLGAPAGITPISFGPAAEKKLFNRKTKVPIYYFDMKLLGEFWHCFGGSNRLYHHTLSATLLYGLREALSQLVEETLPVAWTRHSDAAIRLRKGLQRYGLEPYVKNPHHRLSTVVSVHLPSDVDPKVISARAMEKYKVEISGGLGPTTGKILRIGIMGVNATLNHVDLYLRALEYGMKGASKI